MTLNANKKENSFGNEQVTARYEIKNKKNICSDYYFELKDTGEVNEIPLLL